MVPWSCPARPSTLVSWWQITARIQAFIDHPLPPKTPLHNQRLVAHRRTSYPASLITILFWKLDSPVVIQRSPLLLLFQKYYTLLQGSEEKETGQNELATKPLLFPRKKQEKAIKNKEPGSTSPETAGLARMWSG